MDHRLCRVFCVMVFSLLTTALFAQEDFSADVVDNSEKDSSTPAKIYAGKDKIRIEGSEQNGRSGAMIINFATHTTDILVAGRNIYMESSGNGPSSQRAFHFFRAADPENACDEWRKMAAKPGGSCHKIGKETVNSRSTVKYEGANDDGTTSTVWIDSKLHFPVKWQGRNGSGGELRNIKEGSQPASLFVIPAGYQKLDVGSIGMPAGAKPH